MGARFNFTKLDERTRALMLEEIQAAVDSGNIYFSTRFTPLGKSNFVSYFEDAAREHDEHWLAYQLETTGSMEDLETKAKPKGGYTTAHVPNTAAETFADGQFNRFYIAAICRRAQEDGKRSVVVYRAKVREQARAESAAIEGSEREASTLLEEVRDTKSSFKCDLLKPNSGLSVDY